MSYGVRRDGQLERIAVPLSAYPLARVLADNWTLYLFILYEQAIALFVFARRPHLPPSIVLPWSPSEARVGSLGSQMLPRKEQQTPVCAPQRVRPVTPRQKRRESCRAFGFLP